MTEVQKSRVVPPVPALPPVAAAPWWVVGVSKFRALQRWAWAADLAFEGEVVDQAIIGKLIIATRWDSQTVTVPNYRIAAACGVPFSEVDRVARELVSRGLAVRLPDDGKLTMLRLTVPDGLRRIMR